MRESNTTRDAESREGEISSPDRVGQVYTYAMYELYWEVGTVAMAPHIALEEVGAPYELHHIDTEKDAQQEASFLALNPAGLVPVLVHDGLVVTESAAITQYIATRHPEAGLLPEPGSPAFAETLRWLVFAVTTLQTAGRRMFYADRFSTDASHAEAIEKRAEQHLLAGWKLVDEHALTAGPFIHGEQYSIADIYLVFLTSWSNDPDELRERFPNVGRMYEAATRRPATKRILDLHDEE